MGTRWSFPYRTLRSQEALHSGDQRDQGTLFNC